MPTNEPGEGIVGDGLCVLKALILGPNPGHHAKEELLLCDDSARTCTDP